jgi:hypothetical protein
VYSRQRTNRGGLVKVTHGIALMQKGNKVRGRRRKGLEEVFADTES